MGEHPDRVADHQGPDALSKSPVDDGAGGLVAGLGQAAAMASLQPSGADPVLAPTATAALSPRRGAGGNSSPAGLGVGQVQARLGPQRPPGHHQPRSVRAGHGVTERVWSRTIGDEDPVEGQLRRATVSSVLFGLAWDRYLLRLEPFASATIEGIAAWVGPVVDAAMSVVPGTPTTPPKLQPSVEGP